jgi:two-component system, chemotaxis family, sensor kinase CheA
MSTSDSPESFADGFMDDYFAEAEEHLAAVRRSLLALEARGLEPSPPLVEELFRSFHSLKGISAMVELREAELLAHHMESCLRAIRQERLTLTSASFETLVDGTKMLEQVIAARREGSPAPPLESLFAALEALSREATPSGGAIAAESAPPRGRAPAAPTRLWRVTFVPSPELVARGVKVDTIRTRLAQIGHVLSVAPKVAAGGGVSFEFQVETDQEAQLAAWREDGLSYEANDAAAPPAPSPTESEAAVTVPDAVSAADRTRDRSGAGATNFVRVDLARLDDLMRLVGDMVVSRARLDDTLERIERHVPFQDWRVLQEHSAGIERQLRDLREAVMRVRLVPVGEIFRRMPFVVRDLARDNQKRVQLELAGHTTEIDKFLIERMMDPVLHLVRNAVSHGIEHPEQRLAAGKPAAGTIRLGASTVGESVVLEIADDGGGIDVAAVAARARAAGMAVPEGPLDARGLLDIICSSGFSTRDQADRASGRGVGMAVVRGTVEELGGTLDVETSVGHGTTFRVTLPLTLAITDAIIAHVGDQIFAVPQSAVREVIEVEGAAVRAIERNELLTHRGAALPIVRLSQLFSIEAASRPRYHAIVVGAGLAAVGLLVDRIAGQREIVVKTISDPLIRVDGVSGATELGDGRLVLILDIAGIGRVLRERPLVVAEKSA